MITLYYSILAVITDAFIGDPRWLPHPVRWMGNLIGMGERLFFPRQRTPGREFIAGCAVVVLVCILTAGSGYFFLVFCRFIHPVAETCGSVLIGFYCLSARSLVTEADRVRRLLAENNLPGARKAVAMIVGRDTATLDENGISRATIETIAESTVDGIVSPLFYLTIGGPLAALVFKAVSTMDSMIGYRNERYRKFGTCAARLDDILNYLPARLTAFILMPLGAAASGKNPLHVWKCVAADRKKHPSPNSAHGEAAMAGALGIRLGGPSTYDGIISEKPLLNSGGRGADIRDIVTANRRAVAVAIVAVVTFTAFRITIYHSIRI
jgi:adenosylcobinamide-phosphate synthase